MEMERRATPAIKLKQLKHPKPAVINVLDNATMIMEVVSNAQQILQDYPRPKEKNVIPAGIMIVL